MPVLLVACAAWLLAFLMLWTRSDATRRRAGQGPGAAGRLARRHRAR